MKIVSLLVVLALISAASAQFVDPAAVGVPPAGAAPAAVPGMMPPPAMPGMPPMPLPQMPPMPGMPQMPGMPGMPGMPPMVGMPPVPGMPQIPGMPGIVPTMPPSLPALPMNPTFAPVPPIPTGPSIPNLPSNLPTSLLAALAQPDLAAAEFVPKSKKGAAEGEFSGLVPDPLSLGASPPQSAVPNSADSNTLPPFSSMNSEATTSPGISRGPGAGLTLGVERKIQEAEDLLNRMVWQLNRETSWANSVHDIIQNYQYKYTKVLSNIKKHTDSTKKMRELVQTLKKARLHEILQNDLAKASRELTELSSGSSQTSEDEGSYASIKDRVALMKQDLDKMSGNKIHKVVHSAQSQLKKIGRDAVPPASEDTLKELFQQSAGKK